VKPCQLLADCGTNQDLVRRLQSIADKDAKIRPFAFVDNIQELMAASSLVIGKGGGLTVSESLCLGKPLVLFGSVPGQETRNARTLARQGAARVARSLDDVVRLTTDLMDSPGILKECTSAALRLGRPQAAAVLVRRVLENHE
jgi:processive 1,2-diacylglycerol beta-glucosyltransferase